MNIPGVTWAITQPTPSTTANVPGVTWASTQPIPPVVLRPNLMAAPTLATTAVGQKLPTVQVQTIAVSPPRVVSPISPVAGAVASPGAIATAAPATSPASAVYSVATAANGGVQIFKNGSLIATAPPPSIAQITAQYGTQGAAPSGYTFSPTANGGIQIFDNGRLIGTTAPVQNGYQGPSGNIASSVANPIASGVGKTGVAATSNVVPLQTSSSMQAVSQLLNQALSSTTNGDVAGTANAAPLQSSSSMQAESQLMDEAPSASSWASVSPTSPVANQLQSALNTSAQSSTAKPLTTPGLVVNPASAVQPWSGAGQGGPQPITLNSDLKTSIVSLTPPTPPAPVQQMASVMLAQPTTVTSPQPQPQPYSPFIDGVQSVKNPNASGGCVQQAWRETVTGQVPLPSLKSAIATVVNDGASTAAGSVPGSPSLTGIVNRVGQAQTVAAVATPLLHGDYSDSAAQAVEAG